YARQMRLVGKATEVGDFLDGHARAPKQATGTAQSCLDYILVRRLAEAVAKQARKQAWRELKHCSHASQIQGSGKIVFDIVLDAKHLSSAQFRCHRGPLRLDGSVATQQVHD